MGALLEEGGEEELLLLGYSIQLLISNGSAAPVVHASALNSRPGRCSCYYHPSPECSLIHRLPAHPESAASLLPRIRRHRVAPLQPSPPFPLPTSRGQSRRCFGFTANDSAVSFGSRGDGYARAGSRRAGSGGGGAGYVPMRGVRWPPSSACVRPRRVSLRLWGKPPTSLFYHGQVIVFLVAENRHS
jgi:hypothetical protein